MVVMVLAMIIDSCYYKHHYYLVLIHSCMEGALKNTEFAFVLANGLIREEWQEGTPSLAYLGRMYSREIGLTK